MQTAHRKALLPTPPRVWVLMTGTPSAPSGNQTQDVLAVKRQHYRLCHRVPIIWLWRILKWPPWRILEWRFCDGSISDSVQGPKLYKCTKFHSFMKKWKWIGQNHGTTSQHHWIDHYLWTVYDVNYINGILDHQNIGVDITYSVLSCLVQDLWCKIR